MGVIIIKYRISDVAKLLGITTEAIRYYEDQGIITPTKSEKSGYRYYCVWDLHAIGIIFGAIPGLTAVMAVALFLTITYGMPPEVGISSLIALYVGAVSGGLISAKSLTAIRNNFIVDNG